MTDEPTERDVEAAAYLIHEAECTAYTHEGRNARCHRAARAVLTSTWYAERIAEARRKGAAEALDEAANEAERQWVQQTLTGPVFVAHRTSQWLRDRATALRGDA